MRLFKSALIAIAVGLCCQSCCTLFAPSKQKITFVGERGASIYDKNKKIAEIGDNGTATVTMRKSAKSKKLVAMKEGYKPTVFELEALFDPLSLLNILNCGWGFFVDLGTGKCCSWVDDTVMFDMAKDPAATHTQPTAD